jgi:hypothetical protein
MAATHLLGELVKADDPHAEEIIQRWDEVDRRKGWIRWRWVLFGILAAVSAVALTWLGNMAVDQGLFYRQISNWSGSRAMDNPVEKKLEKYLNDKQKFLLFGDTRRSSKVDQIKALWDSEPENPAYYAQYAGVYLSEHDKLPSDFLEVARRIDPENAWFTYVAAGVESYKCVEKNKQSKAAKLANEPETWTIKDSTKLEKTIELLQYARGQSRCNNYYKLLINEKLIVLPKSNSSENMWSFSFLMGTTLPEVMKLVRLGDAISAKAWLLGEEGNGSELKELILCYDETSEHLLSQQPSNVVESIVYKACLNGPANNLAAAAKKFGLEKEAERFGEINRKFMLERESRKNRVYLVEGQELESKSRILAVVSIPLLGKQAANPPVLKLEDLKPGRLQDHEFLSQLGAGSSLIFLWIGLFGAFIYRFRTPTLIRMLSRRVEMLFRPRDWLWILGAGVLLPFLYVAIINRWTPLGGRDWSIKFSGLIAILPLAHFGGWVVLSLIFPLLIARWRLKLQGGAIGFTHRKAWVGWAVALTGLAFIPMVGWAHLSRSGAGFIVAAGLLAIPALWLLSTIFAALFSSSLKLLHRGAVARVLMPAYAFAALLMISCVPFFHAAEQYWFQQDKLMRLDAKDPLGSMFETKVAIQMQKETRQMLGLEN